MSEWRSVKLIDIGLIITGKTPPTVDHSNYGGDIPFVTPSDMDGRKRIAKTERYLTKKGLECVKSSAIPAEAVMVSCIGSDMGKSVIAAINCVSNQQINSIIVNEGVCAEYVYYDLSRRKEELQRLACSGSAQPILNKGHFSQLAILLPPLPEQKRIAHILGTLDDKIELNRRMNATLEAMARALFKSWFVDFDPVRTKLDCRMLEGLDPETAALFPSEFQDSPLGPIPRGWNVGRLDDVLTLQRGFDLPATERTHGKYPVMAASGPNGCHNKFMVHGPGVTTGRSGVLGKVFFIHGDFWPLNTSLWVKEFKRVSPSYAVHLLRGLDFEMFNAGSAVPTLNRNHVHNLPVVIPPKRIIEAFDAQVIPLMNQQEVNEDQSRILAILRDTLLPRLLSEKQQSLLNQL